MEYISKVWLKEPKPLDKVAEILGLDEINLFSTEDIVGTMKFKGQTILVLIHLSWGEIDRVKKIRIFAHHIDNVDSDELDTIFINRLEEVGSSNGRRFH